MIFQKDQTPATDYQTLFSALCRVQVEDDGLGFDPESVQFGQIKENDECQGIRARVASKLQSVIIRLQVVVGFGDTINPPPESIIYLGTLDCPTESISVYPKETAFAEKFQAMIGFGNGK